MRSTSKVIFLIAVFMLGLISSCSKPKYKTRNGGKRINSIKASGFKQTKRR